MHRRARKTLLVIIFTIVTMIALMILIANIRLHSFVPTQRAMIQGDVLPQLEFIGAALRQGAGGEMQKLFPEGYFFTHDLYGLSWLGLGQADFDSKLRSRALSEARWALAQVESRDGRQPFDPELRPRYGAFYAGWTAWLRGGILRLEPAGTRSAGEVEQFKSACVEIASAVDASPTPFLASYPDQAWPCDSVVAIAALALHDRLFPPQYRATINRWMALARSRMADGLLPHQVDFATGEPLGPARGSSQSIIQRFLPEIDPEFSREQYAIFRSRFVGHVIGAPGVREYPQGATGNADVDSGPLIFGISASATVVSIGAARLHSDEELSRPLTQLSEALGMPVTAAGRKRYALGKLPVGDAFLAWSKTAQPTANSASSGSYTPIAGKGWRIGLHGISLICIALLYMPFWIRGVRKDHRRRQRIPKVA